MGDPAAVFKAYDIRGLVPDELDEGLARDLGGAFALLARMSRATTTRPVAGSASRTSRANAPPKSRARPSSSSSGTSPRMS